MTSSLDNYEAHMQAEFERYMEEEYNRYMEAQYEAYMEEQERARLEYLMGSPEDATRFLEEEDWSEDDFPR